MYDGRGTLRYASQLLRGHWEGIDYCADFHAPVSSLPSTWAMWRWKSPGGCMCVKMP